MSTETTATDTGNAEDQESESVHPVNYILHDTQLNYRPDPESEYTNDAITGNGLGNTLWGEFGNDMLLGMGGDEILWGGEGQDHLSGGDGDDTLIGGKDIDLLYGGDGSDTVSYVGSYEGVTIDLRKKSGTVETGESETREGVGGDAEGDKFNSIENVTGSSYGDVIHGNSEANVLAGEDGDDILNGHEGDDTLRGEAGDDTLDGGAGRDGLDGGGGDDVLHGGAGDDFLFGRDGNDRLFGGDGTDMMSGGEGDDVLNGGGGYDRLFGGAGSDRFVFEGRFGDDVVTDFTSGEDVLDLRGHGVSFEEVLAGAEARGAHTILNLADGRIFLQEVELSELQAGDFLF